VRLEDLIRIGGGNLKSVVVFIVAGIAAYMTCARSWERSAQGCWSRLPSPYPQARICRRSSGLFNF
jgi:hypothetical protein